MLAGESARVPKRRRMKEEMVGGGGLVGG